MDESQLYSKIGKSNWTKTQVPKKGEREEEEEKSLIMDKETGQNFTNTGILWL